ncbi:DUF4198 domain-containing protein [Beggiatoa leptomitoformis]|uniref:DUF4198 domain-containing protein n=1 Tax=Beggiatoa leptomitoformis TaxID=288004 RepID=A0A2N9YBT1_9GAMM|nr:DUF4198 domain-containing protein [Beggiatoa leptomitoformis]ALG66730.1 DUF4198 domain-containing protein [Beggiatoa leptomitoformis]AUI67935.1 DUF4198 domain-containing protein [Beggiatoa leptomitoformis]
MQRLSLFIGLLLSGLVSFFPLMAHAHFQTLLPSQDIVNAEDEKNIILTLVFTHPMEQSPVMNMGEPKQFGVLVQDEKINLLPTLTLVKQQDKNTYSAKYLLTRPADHIFYVEPAPYWEAAENKFIVHYTKVVVSAFGAETGWDKLVGFPIEIEPLVRPYGLWTGNIFRGIVKKNGQAVPYAKIEVEYWNEHNTVVIPADPFVTQVLKTNAQGEFSYAMPKAGWWAFAALVEGDTTMLNPDGKPVAVELGGLIWVHTVDMQ